MAVPVGSSSRKSPSDAASSVDSSPSKSHVQDPPSLLQQASARDGSSQQPATPRPRRKQLGFEGEALVAQTLRARGFEILVTNFRTRYGELDLVARQGKNVWMVEVKTRLRASPLGVEISRTQQGRLTRMAYRFLATLREPPESVIFVVAIVRLEQQVPVVEFIEQAFDATF